MSRYKTFDDVLDEDQFSDLELPEDRDLETESQDDDDDYEPYDREDFYNGRDDYWDDEE